MLTGEAVVSLCHTVVLWLCGGQSPRGQGEGADSLQLSGRDRGVSGVSLLSIAVPNSRIS